MHVNQSRLADVDRLASSNVNSVDVQLGLKLLESHPESPLQVQLCSASAWVNPRAATVQYFHANMKPEHIENLHLVLKLVKQESERNAKPTLLRGASKGQKEAFNSKRTDTV